MTRWLSRALLLGAVGLVGLAGYLAYRPDGGEPPFVVEETDRNVGSLPVGTHKVVFRLTYPADKPRRIIGLAEG